MPVEQLVGCRWNKRSDAVDYARLVGTARDMGGCRDAQPYQWRIGPLSMWTKFEP